MAALDVMVMGVVIGTAAEWDYDDDSVTFFDFEINDAGKSFFAEDIGQGKILPMEKTLLIDLQRGVFETSHDMTAEERKAALESGELSPEDNEADAEEVNADAPPRQQVTRLRPSWINFHSLPRKE